MRRHARLADFGLAKDQVDIGPGGFVMGKMPMAIPGSDLLEVPIPYISPIFEAYVREYPHKIWPEIWYSTCILGSWRSPIENRDVKHPKIGIKCCEDGDCNHPKP